MSQIYKPLTSGGPIPPNIPITFQAQNDGVNDGTATAAANIINFNVTTSTVNDTDGMQVSASGNTVNHFLTNRASVTATTSDGGGQSQTVTLFTPVVGTSISFRMLVTGYDAVNNETTGGELLGIARRSGVGVTFVVGTNDTFDEFDETFIPSLDTADYDVVTNGTILQVQFVGVATRTIVWRALFEYVQST